MFLISREFTFCYGHRLLNYDGKCSRPHGHNALVRVTLSADSLNSSGMVRDFSEVKSELGDWIDTNLDHRMILAAADPLTDVFTQLGEPFYSVEANPTAENLARLIFEVAQKKGFPVREVEFHETEKCIALYRAD